MRGGSDWRRWGPFHFDFGDNGSGGGAARGRSAMFESGELRLVLLKLIADEPRHGYDLIRAIEELTGGEYAPSPGVVYPTLTLLRTWASSKKRPAEGPRKPFQVTDEGRQHLEEKAEEVEASWTVSKESRAQGNARQRATLGRADPEPDARRPQSRFARGWDEDLTHEITAILDEAAQRIERAQIGTSALEPGMALLRSMTRLYVRSTAELI
jgi:DNA-binding PadR family transcriptional regulator